MKNKYYMIEIVPYKPYIRIFMLSNTTKATAYKEAKCIANNDGNYIVLNECEYKRFMKRVLERIQQI